MPVHQQAVNAQLEDALDLAGRAGARSSGVREELEAQLKQLTAEVTRHRDYERLLKQQVRQMCSP